MPLQRGFIYISNHLCDAFRASIASTKFQGIQENDMSWNQIWTTLGIAFAIVAGTVTITLAITDRQISGLERLQAQQAQNTLATTGSQISELETSLQQLERSQAQQAQNTLDITSSQISGLETSLQQLERSQAQQAQNTLDITSRQISELEKLQAQQAQNTLAVTGSRISGLETSLQQLERSQAQQAQNTLALINAHNENMLKQVQSLNDKMTSIEAEHVELRSLYQEVGGLQTEVEYIRGDLNTMRANQEMILKILRTLENN